MTEDSLTMHCPTCGTDRPIDHECTPVGDPVWCPTCGYHHYANRNPHDQERIAQLRRELGVDQ